MKNNSGYVSVEAVFALSIFLIMFLMCISMFTYVYPQIQLQNEVKALSVICERQGGLTDEDILNFESSLQKYSFVAESEIPVIVTAETYPSGLDAIGVTGLDETGTNYIKRNSREIIGLTIKIPTNNSFVNQMMHFFDVAGVGDYYVFYEPVMSERF